MKLLLVILLSVGCGRVGVSDSKHEVGGEATVRIVVGVDVKVCDDLSSAERLECIKAIVELAKAAATSKDGEDGGFDGLY
jgi:hypothetical protein